MHPKEQISRNDVSVSWRRHHQLDKVNNRRRGKSQRPSDNRRDPIYLKTWPKCTSLVRMVFSQQPPLQREIETGGKGNILWSPLKEGRIINIDDDTFYAGGWWGWCVVTELLWDSQEGRTIIANCTCTSVIIGEDSTRKLHRKEGMYGWQVLVRLR